VADTQQQDELALIRPEIRDWGAFFFWAQAEYWQVLPAEAALFRGPLADWAFALRSRDQTCGFATAVPYADFAWIGNLIIAPEKRGMGLGRHLFDQVCDKLRRSGIQSLWLTASEQGRPLYASRGFRPCDRIERWQMFIPPLQHCSAPVLPTDLEHLYRMDRRVWGTDRRLILQYLATGGRIIRTGNSIALLQNYGSLKVLGPWLSREHSPREHAAVIRTAIRAAGGGTLHIDVLASTGAAALLAECGFTRSGCGTLMVACDGAVCPPKQAVALASLGSLG